MADAPLYTSTRERRRQTDLADFYALLKASEAVEKAYARGAVSAADYETACSQLMAQLASYSTLATAQDWRSRRALWSISTMRLRLTSWKDPTSGSLLQHSRWQGGENYLLTGAL